MGKKVDTDYPLIDSDPHFKRVIGYARKSDYVAGAATATAGPGLMLLWERIAPSLVGKGGFAPIMRLSGAIGLSAGFLMFYQRSILRFYGFTENSRYSGVWLHVLPWFNFVNHNQHGVDTAKYYQQAERELEAEKN